jgi:hypothetical protein
MNCVMIYNIYMYIYIYVMYVDFSVVRLLAYFPHSYCNVEVKNARNIYFLAFSVNKEIRLVSYAMGNLHRPMGHPICGNDIIQFSSSTKTRTS